MIDLEAAHARYDALREHDRSIALMQSKQRMRPVFAELLDETARASLDEALRERLGAVRTQARKLAAELARRVLLDLGVNDLGRLGGGLQQLDAYLGREPSEALDVCLDLLTFIEQRAHVFDGVRLRARPHDP